MAKIKTNAIRLLDKNKINYSCKEYEATDGKIDGIAVAAKLGVNPNEVFKTLLVQGISKECYVCVIPVNKELDFKKISKITGEKKVEMLHVNDLLKTTGYVRGGCSPIGMKKLFKTFLDETAQKLETITVSGGKIGIQITLEPEELRKIVKAEYVAITAEY
ncbi:MAG: Cys-tRNA(Pro) deacylase [Cellulosilyticaceae bacterium]